MVIEGVSFDIKPGEGKQSTAGPRERMQPGLGEADDTSQLQSFLHQDPHWIKCFLRVRGRKHPKTYVQPSLEDVKERGSPGLPAES